MEKHFLKSAVNGTPAFKAEPWYNPFGDCIVYHMANEAIVADRIDEILTIYRSAIDNCSIGYQIKGVYALIRKFGWDGLACRHETSDGEVTSVSIAALLLAAYEDGPKTPNRRRAYASVMEYPQGHGIPREDLVPA